ncbi:MAG: hypothetical protein NXI22_03885 [bacterium]|nr:hypothetical protein [bacterium]
MKLTSKTSLWISSIALASLALGCARQQPNDPSTEVEVVSALRTAFEGDAVASTNTGSDEPAAEPTGWATVSGQFTFSGAPPQMGLLDTSKSSDNCGVVKEESLVVDSATGGLRDVLIFVSEGIAENDSDANEPKWVHPEYSLVNNSERSTVEFDQKSCRFLSHVFAMQADQTLKILNSDPFGHNTNLAPTEGAATFNQTIPGNGFASYTPGGETRQPFKVTCSIHPWMNAWMLTRKDPYFAVTGADGKFTIANLPAGVPLEFRVWQEKAEFVESVTVNGSSEKWSKGKFTLTLEPGAEQNLNVVVDNASL